MKKYDSYKDSGIDWIGQIPSHWKVIPFKRAMIINNGCDYKHIQVDEGYPVLGSGGQFAYANEWLYDGEALLLGRKGTIDKPMYYNGKFWTVDTMFYSVPLKNAHCKYMFYQSLGFPFDYYSTATALPSMAASDLENNPVALPPLSEQKKIAEYLDRKCSEIDVAVAKVDKEVELLDELKQSEISKAVTKGLSPNVSFKPSGFDWIGQIPNHWKITRLKNNLDIFGRIGFRGYTNEDLVEEGEGAITLSPSNIIDGKIDYSKCSYLSWKKYYESPEIMIKEGDVIFVKTASVGKSALITHLPIETTLNPQIVVFKNLKIENRYLDYLLKTPLIDSQVKLSVGGSTILTITQEAIGSYRIPTPPISEQKEIADYLDRKCAEINSLKEKLKQKKEKLQELRQSLISEVVTGKRCVINS